mmetsp:Transcript_70297/g.195657  ORF Transcript_70297/g.195657 Transcript_70297/m.195657 type:complete len:227 (+) Transcript_70297:1945-2625(+)
MVAGARRCLPAVPFRGDDGELQTSGAGTTLWSHTKNSGRRGVPVALLGRVADGGIHPIAEVRERFADLVGAVGAGPAALQNHVGLVRGEPVRGAAFIHVNPHAALPRGGACEKDLAVAHGYGGRLASRPWQDRREAIGPRRPVCLRQDRSRARGLRRLCGQCTLAVVLAKRERRAGLCDVPLHVVHVVVHGADVCHLHLGLPPRRPLGKVHLRHPELRSGHLLSLA